MRCNRWCAGALLLLAVEAVEGQSGPLPSDSLERARTWGRWFQEGKMDSLFSAVAPGGRGVLGSRESLAAVQGEIVAMAGRFTGVTEERFVWRAGNRQYWRTMTTERAPEPVVVRFVVRPDGLIHGFGASLLSQVPSIDSGGPPIRTP